MDFYDVNAADASDNSPFYDGEWSPYPDDLYALYTDPGVPEGLHIRIRTGRKLGDMIFAAFNVISERFLEVLRSSHATGFDVFPVPVTKNNKLLATFYGLKIHGRGGPFDPDRSDADQIEDFIHGYSAIYMDESQWDGSDVFFIPGLGIGLFVTERVAEALEKAKLKSVMLTLNSECAYGTKAPLPPGFKKPGD